MTDRHVVTCAHVLSARVEAERPRGTVYVQFQFVGSSQPLPAEVAQDGWFPELADGKGDLAVLELSAAAPQGARPAPLRCSSDGVWDHRYRAYGYPRGHANRGVWSQGRIIGAAGDEWLQLQADSALGFELEPGFSGAAIWDEALAAVVAIVITRDRPRGDQSNPRTGYGVPVEVIEQYWPALRGSPELTEPKARNQRATSTAHVVDGAGTQSVTSGKQAAASDVPGSVLSDGVPAAVRRLVESLSDVDSGVRFSAMSALGDRLSPELLPIIEPLLTDSDRYIRQLAVDYYAQLSGPDGTDRLVQALSDSDSSVRFSAMSALGDRLSPELLPIIEPLLTDSDRYIRQLAVDYYSELS